MASTELPTLYTFIRHWATQRPQRPAMVGERRIDDAQLDAGTRRGAGLNRRERIAWLGKSSGAAPDAAVRRRAHRRGHGCGRLAPGRARTRNHRARHRSQAAVRRQGFRRRRIHTSSQAVAGAARIQRRRCLGVDHRQRARRRRAQGPRRSPILQLCTSGTTGLPTGVMHSHATVLWIILTQSATVDLHGGDRFLLSLPMFHVGALAPAMSCICNGAALVIPKSFEPRLSWQLIGSEGITGTLMVPAMLQAMLATHDAAGHDTRSLRWFMSGAAPVPLNLIPACADKGFEVHQVCGLTESGGPGCLLLGADALQRAGSTGRGFFHTEARGVGLDGSECRCGDPGEVPLRGPNLMVGCWSRPDATAQAFTRDGWLRTGDVGTMDDEGFVTLRDRLKDMLISGGENVYPAEVENMLLSHPQIADAAVLGLPSPKWGEVPLAVLVKKPAAALTEADLLGWCKGKLASLELPKVVVFAEAIPRNPSGKILKRVLREQLLETVRAPE